MKTARLLALLLFIDSFHLSIHPPNSYNLLVWIRQRWLGGRLPNGRQKQQRQRRCDRRAPTDHSSWESTPATSLFPFFSSAKQKDRMDLYQQRRAINPRVSRSSESCVTLQQCSSMHRGRQIFSQFPRCRQCFVRSLVARCIVLCYSACLRFLVRWCSTAASTHCHLLHL